MRGKKKQPRIGFICSPWVGGSGVIATELFSELERRGYYVRFITFDKPFKLRRQKIKITRVEPLHYPLLPHPLYQLPLTEQLVRSVKKHKLTVLHCHYIIPFGMASIEAKRILESEGYRLKVILTVHGTDIVILGKKLKRTTRAVLESADEVTAVSKDLAKRAERVYKLNRSVRVIPDFVDTSLFKPKSSKKENKIKTLVHISNFRPIKRIDHLIEVFSQVHKSIPSRLLLIGEGPDTIKARQLANLNGLTPYVKNVGTLRDPSKLLKDADVILTTSEYESFGLVNLEAMACGVPVAAYKVGGIPEVVVHKKSGMLTNFGDTKKLSKYVIEMLSESKYEKFRKNAREQALLFDSKRIVPLYEKIYA